MSDLPGYRYSEEEIGYLLRRTRRGRAAKARKREGSLLSSFCAFIVEHQLGFSITLSLILCFTHTLFPEARPHTRKFYQLSYYDASAGTYDPGWDDLLFALFWLNMFMGMRSALMVYVLNPLAIRGGVHKKKAIERFSEQGWLVIYYSISFGSGMWLWTESKYWLNLHELWTDYPQPGMSGMMKRYYLIQFAYWLQQIITIHIEKHRKDHWQMLTHHVITSVLLFTSYNFYMTRVGNVILCIMDVADIVLSSAKVLRYLAYQTACDIAFGVFIAAWFVTRHIFFPIVIWSIWADLPVVMPLGCYSSATREKISRSKGNRITHYLQPFYEPGGVICFDKRTHLHFLGLLTFLECIALVWFVMIVRVAWRVIKGHGAVDSRSDDEGEEEGTMTQADASSSKLKET